MKPVTPLPWKTHASNFSSQLRIVNDNGQDVIGVSAYVKDGKGTLVLHGTAGLADAAYITHAANIYPELVAALDELVAEYDERWRVHCAENIGHYPPDDTGGIAIARALLDRCKGE